MLLPQAIRRFREAYPDVSVTLTDPVMGLQIEQLHRAAIDLTIVRGPVNIGRTLRSERLRSDLLMLAIPEGNRLAAADEVDLHALAEEPFVELALYRAYGFKELVRGICARAGFTPNVVMEADTIETMLMSVAAGFGVAIMHDAGHEIPIPGVAYRPLRPKPPLINLQAIWRADDKNPAILPFVRCLKDAARSYGRQRQSAGRRDGRA